MAPHQIVDGFLEAPGAYRLKALTSEFYDIKGPDGGVYKNIHVRPTTEHKANIEAAIGRPIEQDYSFLRYAVAGTPLNHLIHADSGLAPFACVLYLNPDDQIPEGSGTGFYQHKKLGYQRVPTEHEVRSQGKSPKRVWETLEASWNDATAWTETGRVQMKYNRAVIFETTNFHSRLPWAAFGSCIGDARLIFVSFFRA
jgi:hypothetical protein